jgi:hypothetical protein
MRLLIISSAFAVAAIVSGCAGVEDDGYLAPPGYDAFDLRAATERAHAVLAGSSYQRATLDTDCREACDVFERGFAQARQLRLTSPAKCTDEFEIGLWSQTEYQEGCRAYALKVLVLIDQYRQTHREGVLL